MEKYCTFFIKSNNLFDCYVYKKLLYVVTRDKRVIPIDWFRFINSRMPPENAFAFTLSFLRGDVLYGGNYDLFRNTENIKKEILKSFASLKNAHFEIEFTSLLNYAQKEKWWRTINELPAEIRCYKNKFYFLQNDGLHYFDIQAGNTEQCYRNVLSHDWIQAYGSYVNFNFVGMDLYLCGLSDGLFIQDYIDESFYEDDVRKISTSHTSYICNNFNSYLRGSYVGDSEFVRTSKNFPDIRENVERINLPFEKNYQYFSLLDKVYKIGNGNIWYSINKKDQPLIFEPLSININMEEFVGATVAVFGLIIEEKNRLIVIPSDSNESPLIIESNEDSIISWRIYPTSIDYKNQLHVISEKGLKIYSFYYDYFINQFDKKIGARHFALKTE